MQVKVSLLSEKFLHDYPSALYPELMHKKGRPYSCLLIPCHTYYICVPFRSSIQHNNAYHFRTSQRSQTHHSGLDYSKIAIIQNPDYFDTSCAAIVDQDEYSEMMHNLPTIANQATAYVDAYVRHITGAEPLHPRQFQRQYKFSTLPYFHEILLGGAGQTIDNPPTSVYSDRHECV